MNLQEPSVYLESREGLLASGIGWSLVLCFGAAYACYYLRTIAKEKYYMGEEIQKSQDGRHNNAIAAAAIFTFLIPLLQQMSLWET